MASDASSWRRVVIFGGAGFIGSNLAHRLSAGGTEVVAVDDLATGARDHLPAGTELIQADCADPAVVRELGGKPIDAVFHLAGPSSAPMYDDQPRGASAVVAGFQNALELARAADAPVGYASTSSFYAGCPKPYREDMPVSARTLYEFGKLSMENLARTYHARYRLPSVGFRFFSVYGPREEAKGRFANVASQFLWAMRRGDRPVIYGDGSQTRDFTHVSDLLEGIVAGLSLGGTCDVYNVGTGIEHDFNSLVSILNGILGTDLKPFYVDNPVPNYVSETLADNTKLRALGWAPKIRLETGLRQLAATAPVAARPA